MKKIFSVIFIMAIMLSLAACGPININTDSHADFSGTTDGSATAESEIPGDTNIGSSESSNADSRILIAYFSATGNTKKSAEYAADIMDADLYEIVPAEPYTASDLDYSNNDCRANREMKDDTCRPKISGSVNNMADYDIVFIGYPIWWGKEPKIMSTFVESYDFSGKTVVTFCTSGSSPNNDSTIKSLAVGANWISGKRLNSNASKSDISELIDSIGLN